MSNFDLLSHKAREECEECDVRLAELAQAVMHRAAQLVHEVREECDVRLAELAQAVMHRASQWVHEAREEREG